MIQRALALMAMAPLLLLALAYDVLTWRRKPRRDDAQTDYDMHRM
jgi:cytochrome c oxidase assembly factor CtaG